MLDLKSLETEQVSRRGALKRFGKLGIAATAGAGALELIGVGGAKAATSRGWARGKIDPRTGEHVALAANPDSTAATCCGALAVGHCGGPCSSGYWCYKVDGCGLSGYWCLSCPGTQACCYQ